MAPIRDEITEQRQNAVARDETRVGRHGDEPEFGREQFGFVGDLRHHACGLGGWEGGGASVC